MSSHGQPMFVHYTPKKGSLSSETFPVFICCFQLLASPVSTAVFHPASSISFHPAMPSLPSTIDHRYSVHPCPADQLVCGSPDSFFFSSLPARLGSGKARYWVKGLVPCRFLGQHPKPSESLLELISAIFKVHLSLFLWLCFS